MPFDLNQLAPLIGGAGNPRNGSAFLRGWQRGQQEIEARKMREQQGQAQQEDRTYRQAAEGRASDANTRANEANTRAQEDQRRQAILSVQQLLTDPAIDDPTVFDQRAQFAGQMVPGVDPGFLQSLRPAPTVFQQRQAKKKLAEIEKSYGTAQVEMLESDDQTGSAPVFEVGGEQLTIAQLRQRAGVGATVNGQPMSMRKPTAAETPNTPEEQFYQRFAEENGAKAFSGLPTAKQSEARKQWMQADDRPMQGSDPEIAELRKELLRSQVERAGNEKDPNQGQFTAAGYAGRMEQAETTLQSVEPAITKMLLPSFEVQTNSWFAKPTFQSADVQSYMQAARNFVNAVLRRESGAVISPSEFAEARKQYLPQPGDTPEATAQKRANREYVFTTMRRSAGRAYEPPVRPPGREKPAIGSRHRTRDGRVVEITGYTDDGKALVREVVP